ncbi:acetoin utilization AcuB family protein [Evansella halocellulosilytica]|uniref:acetoin utilization AcuB family protein n=1 Tax=Evansella halocellulosilytica TaxID=2011013 RepID=UPI000BB793D1|nr:acetoin utilization AcuB family protein [Evansella halocellulosilytica]
MVIEEIMKKTVITAKKETSIQSAVTMMQENRIRHLPVINDDYEIVGIISDRDLKEASPSKLQKNKNDLDELPISELMIKDVLTALPSDFVEEAANTMIEQQISCLPVEEDGKLIGIITETDLLKTLVKLTGANQPTSRLEVEVPNTSGMLGEVANLIKSYNINIQSVLVYPSKDEYKKILVFRLQTMDLRMLSKALRKEGYHVIWPIDMELKS